MYSPFFQIADTHLQCRLLGDHVTVHPVRLVQQGIDAAHRLLPVLLTLDRVHGAARPGQQSHVELGILAEAASIAQKRVFLVVVDGAALVALEHVLPAVAAHAGRCRDRGAAPRTLQRFRGRADVLVEVDILDLQVAGDDRQREVDLDLCLSRLQGDGLRLVPESGLVLQLHGGLVLFKSVTRIVMREMACDCTSFTICVVVVNLESTYEKASAQKNFPWIYLDGRQLQGLIGNFGIITDQARLALQIESVQLH